MFQRVGILLLLVIYSNPALAQSSAAPATSPSSNSGAQPQPAAADSSSISSLFLGLGDDFRNIPSIETAVILGIGGGLSLVVQEEDAAMTRRFSSSARLDTLLEPGEAPGNGAAQIGAAIGIYVVGRRMHSPRVSLVGADLIRAQIVNTTMTQGLKFAVDRRRPDGTRFSFPSGHTSSSFATAAVLQRHFGWRVGLPAYGLAAFVGGSRLQENRHYLSDVIFGAAIGVVAGRATTVGHGKATFAVAPFATAHGGGLGLTLMPAR